MDLTRLCRTQDSLVPDSQTTCASRRGHREKQMRNAADA
jgi:hypothetical protein